MNHSKLFRSVKMMVTAFEKWLNVISSWLSVIIAKRVSYRGFIKLVLRMIIFPGMIFSSLISTVHGQVSCPLIIQNELGNFIASPSGSTTTLWFNLHVKLNSNQLTSNGDYLAFSGGSIIFTGINTSFGSTVSLPGGEIIADATAGSPSTSFSFSTNTWVTRVPPGYSSPDLFISGAAITSGTGYTLSGGNNFTTVSGVLTSNKLLSSTWTYGLACYQGSFSNTTIGSVNAANNIPGSGYPAGTPTGQTGNLTAGGSGSGGSNYTGTLGSSFNFTSCVNTSPTAYAGPDQQLAAGTTSVTLSGSGTGTVINFVWTKISGGSATITNPSSASTSVTGLTAGSYTFNLQVTDLNTNATANSTVQITVLSSGTSGSTQLNHGNSNPYTVAGQSYNLQQANNDWQGIAADRSAAYQFNFIRNYVTSDMVRDNVGGNTAYLLQFGEESPASNNWYLNNMVISGNSLNWTGGYRTPQIQPHGVFAAYSIDDVITFNYVNQLPMAIIQKGDGTHNNDNSVNRNSKGAIAYNIVYNPMWDAVNIKGMGNTNVFNNTFYSSVVPAVGLIDIYDNSGTGGVSFGTHIYNNIFYSTSTAVMNIHLETSDCLTGFQSDYNLFYCEAGTPMFKIGNTTYTFSQWQALGYDTHSVVVNPNFNNFTDFVPAAPLNYGTNLGPAWQAGLAANAVWSTAAMPATANQGANWQVGARVVPNIQTPAVLPVAADTGPITVSVYPNPYVSEVNFNITSPVSGKGTLEIYDLSGAMVASVFVGDFMAGSPKTVTYRLGTTQRQMLVYILKIGDNIMRGKLLPRE